MSRNNILESLSQNRINEGKEDNISVDNIKEILQDIGIDTLTGIPLSKLVVGQGKIIKVTLGTEMTKNLEIIRDKICDVLKKNNIKYDDNIEKYFGDYAVIIPKN
jgi:hypothetical protein